MYIVTTRFSVSDHPFKTSACLRGRGVYPLGYVPLSHWGRRTWRHGRGPCGPNCNMEDLWNDIIEIVHWYPVDVHNDLLAMEWSRIVTSTRRIINNLAHQTDSTWHWGSWSWRVWCILFFWRKWGHWHPRRQLCLRKWQFQHWQP